MQDCFANGGNGNAAYNSVNAFWCNSILLVKSLMPHVNCTGKYTAINQRQLGAGSEPIDVEFASGG
jgi:hypothetical protein